MTAPPNRCRDGSTTTGHGNFVLPKIRGLDATGSPPAVLGFYPAYGLGCRRRPPPPPSAGFGST